MQWPTDLIGSTRMEFCMQYGTWLLFKSSLFCSILRCSLNQENCQCHNQTSPNILYRLTLFPFSCSSFKFSLHCLSSSVIDCFSCSAISYFAFSSESTVCVLSYWMQRERRLQTSGYPKTRLHLLSARFPFCLHCA